MWRATLHGEWESSDPSIERYAIARMFGVGAEYAKSCIFASDGSGLDREQPPQRSNRKT